MSINAVACGLCVSLLCIGFSEADVSSKCLQCICLAEGCDVHEGKCQLVDDTLVCGPYQIKYNYWADCGKPEGDFTRCAKQKACSETCVRNYMARFARRCTGARTPTCRDYARIHDRGPRGCVARLAINFWQRVSDCCGENC